jgi:hypothetical protein
MIRFCAGVAATAVLALVAVADDKKEDKKDQPIQGTWVREADGGSITINYKTKSEMVVTVEAGGNKIVVTCEYSADKDGAVKGKITKVEGDGEGKPPEGYEFKFKFKTGKETAKLTDFEGENAENAKAVLEGEYKKKLSD